MMLFATLAIFFVLFAPFVSARTHTQVARQIRAEYRVEKYLDAHNTIRAAHNAQPLVWSEALAGMAENYANQCKFQPTYQSLRPEPYGENISVGTGRFTIDAFVYNYVQEAGAYDPSNPTFNHLTQIVWKSTTEVGCAAARCNGIVDPQYGEATLHVCFYNPAGNVVGQASENVQL